MKPLQTIPPGAVIGILGGGQLGRMIALAAARLGYQAHIYCQAADEPAAQVAGRVTLGAFEDNAALAGFAGQVDVVTLEWENIPIIALEAVNAITPVHPGAAALAMAQDRLLEKDFARSLGLGTADYYAVNSADALAAALRTLPPPAILKARRMGYDGKGQARLSPGDNPAIAWQVVGGAAAILETMVDFDCEVSVIVARCADGALAAFPPVRNIHQGGILAETRIPAAIPAAVAQEAVDAAQHLAAALDIVGLLAVEMFVLRQPNAAGQNILINEFAPRPHNSGHWTLDACATSQFEQLVRAICGLPLGAVNPADKAVMHNLIGGEARGWEKWLAMPGAHLHLYGKKDIRPGRKMGHVTIRTAEDG